jgi:hypothetical protein
MFLVFGFQFSDIAVEGFFLAFLFAESVADIFLFPFEFVVPR